MTIRAWLPVAVVLVGLGLGDRAWAAPAETTAETPPEAPAETANEIDAPAETASETDAPTATESETDAPAETRPEGPVDDAPAADAEEPADEPEADDAVDEAVAPVKPPRVDGAYIGAVVGGGLTFTRVNDLDTPAPFVGPGGFVRIGEVVFPWMSIGVQAGGRAGWINNQRVAQGAVLVELGFLPAPKKLPLSLLVGFGAGGGAVNEEGVEDRSGFGGAAFKGAVRYDLFPGADLRRPNRGGGFSIGPELGWIGYTPAAAGRPMSNTVYLGLWIGYYFGS